MNNLHEMAYPEAFSMDTLLSLSSYKKKVEYADTHLQKIASGSSRIAYKVDDEKVLKVAKNKKGLAQNLAESDWGIQDMYPNLVAKVFETDDDGIFLEMELARKVTPTKFRSIFGFTHNDLHDYLWYYHDEMNGRRGSRFNNKKQMEENEWVMDLIDMAINYDYPIPGDFGRLSTYGLVHRNGEENIVIIDFGFTNSVFQQYYKR